MADGTGGSCQQKETMLSNSHIPAQKAAIVIWFNLQSQCFCYKSWRDVGLQSQQAPDG